MTKFFNKLKKPYFDPFDQFLPISGAKKVFQKIWLSCTSPYRPPTLLKKLQKQLMSQSKKTSGRAKEQKEGPLFIGT